VPRESGEPPAASSAEVQEHVTAYWNGRAGPYDQHPLSRVHARQARSAWEAILTEALPAPPADVLDVGTGTGFLAVVMAGLGHRVTGIDLATDMLAVAREKAVGLATPPGLRAGDAVDPPFPPGASTRSPAATCCGRSGSRPGPWPPGPASRAPDVPGGALRRLAGARGTGARLVCVLVSGRGRIPFLPAEAARLPGPVLGALRRQGPAHPLLHGQGLLQQVRRLAGQAAMLQLRQALQGLVRRRRQPHRDGHASFTVLHRGEP
jgi:SAM-dependent methyltransferase